MSNVQTALMAAATVYGGSRAYASPAVVTDLAGHFLVWLDKRSPVDDQKLPASMVPRAPENSP